MALISVIMTGYNAQETIERAIRSVMNQTFADWRLIVVDDGSKDETPQILTRLQEELRDPRLRFLIGEPNVGLPAARNKAMELIESEWVTFLDADDEFTPDRLEQGVAAITDDVDMIVCRHTIIGQGNHQERGIADATTVPGTTVAEWVLTETATTYAWDKMYRTSALKGLRYEQVHRAEDKVFNVKAAMLSKQVRFIPAVLIEYYVSPTSLTWGRVSSIEETQAVNTAVQAASGVLANTTSGRKALRTSKVLAYLAVAHQMIFNGMKPALLAEHYSWADALAALRTRPPMGIASLLLKASHPFYSLLYKKVWLPRYGL